MGALQTSPLTFHPPLRAIVLKGIIPEKRNASGSREKTLLFRHPTLKSRKPNPIAEPIGEKEISVERAHQGDCEELNVLFDRDRSRLYRAAFAVLRNKEEAEDAVQEGLLSAYLHLASFQGRSLFSTWLTRITINAALMKRRKQMATPEISLDGEVGDASESAYVTAMPSTGPDPEQLCAASEIREIIRNKMNQLSDGHRSAIQLRYIEGLSTTEAARSSAISVCKLKSRLFHARRQLALRWGNHRSNGKAVRLIRPTSQIARPIGANSAAGRKGSSKFE